MSVEFRTKKYRHMFKVFDVNSDGAFDEDDTIEVVNNLARTYHTSPNSPAFVKMLDDYRNWWKMLSGMLDADGDGHVTQEEFVGFWTNFVDQAQARAAEGDDTLRGMVAASGDMTFDFLDQDHNGEISLEEYTNWLKGWKVDTNYAACFANLDLNGDGVITRDEAGTLLQNFIFSDDPNAPGSLLYGTLS
jgi:Ca2+-binding EF-hand superfamily protein